MTNISTAVGTDRISRIVGYKLRKGFEPVSGVNLPQRIAILAPANSNMQTGLPTQQQVTSAAEAANLFGYGSPIHSIMRILRPISGDGVGGIPTVVYPQADPGGAAAATRELTVTTAAVTANATHRILVNGRDNIDGQFYSFTVLTTDTQATIAAKIVAAINSVISAPVSAVVNNVNDNQVDITCKFAGTIGNDLSVEVVNDGVSAGVTYAVAVGTAGAGDHSIAGALTAFGSAWNTIVINAYGTTTFDALETFNGIPDPINPTGLYSGITFRPFFALWGSTETSRTSLVAITGASARQNQVTNVLCPAPGSDGWPYEAAANGAFLLANTSQNSPHLDVSAQFYPDMPVPEDQQIGDMANYNDRDVLVKNGASTVDLVSGRYQIQDFITTYRPDGEIPPQFRYVRSLVQDFNVRYGYLLLENVNVRDKAIASNEQTVTVANVIKPKIWNQILRTYADSLATRALITDPDFMKNSIQIQTGTGNPDRLETFFRYRRSPYARIASTDAEARFTFGLTN